MGENHGGEQKGHDGHSGSDGTTGEEFSCRPEAPGKENRPRDGRGGDALKEFETTRFGRIPLDPDRILTFPEGLLGFPDVSRFYLLETSEPSIFFWLQAVDEPGLAFVVMDSEDLMPGYLDKVRTILADPLFRDEEMSSMVIVTVPGSEPEKMTANLQGPLLIRSSDRLGRQVVLFDEEGWLRYPLLGA